MVKPRKPKAADITDAEFKAALNKDRFTTLRDLVDRLGFPEKVVLAKARTLIRKDRGVEGCYCGCRGDFYSVYPADYPPPGVPLMFLSSSIRLTPLDAVLEIVKRRGYK